MAPVNCCSTVRYNEMSITAQLLAIISSWLSMIAQNLLINQQNWPLSEQNGTRRCILIFETLTDSQIVSSSLIRNVRNVSQNQWIFDSMGCVYICHLLGEGKLEYKYLSQKFNYFEQKMYSTNAGIWYRFQILQKKCTMPVFNTWNWKIGLGRFNLCRKTSNLSLNSP